jgi:hypothetical protein
MLVFIDESGNHNLNYSHIDDPYTVFVLAGVCINEVDYQFFDRKFKELKQELFDDESFIIHTAEITRPSNSKSSHNLKFNNPEFRQIFYSKINNLISETPFEIVSCIIKKKEFSLRDGTNEEDPYIFSLSQLVDRIAMKCNKQVCKLYPEKRDKAEDLKIELEFLRLKTIGTKHFRGAEISEKIEEFVLKDKKNNISGLQLADLIVTPIGRNFINKPPKPAGNEILYSVVKSKIKAEDLIIYP